MSTVREFSTLESCPRLLRILLLCLLPLLLAEIVVADERQYPETVPRVDLDRYVGTWYEIARLPNSFQRQCSGNVTADYRRLDDGNIGVVNRCIDKNGGLDEAHGVARVVDKSTNAKLEVSFVSIFGWRLFWGDYWILYLDDDYTHVVVGTRNRRYAWILARAPTLSAPARDRCRRILQRAGYDPDELIDTRQTQ
ncbi:MAG TPA: lipocalin family protein [Gammaproteobacteria bacterium]|nr:lipocalin family protein [Gammaproteobacteria bacterium]